MSLGFEKIGDRSSWKFLPDATCVFKVQAVGAYFSEVTGWPPSSLHVELAVQYSFIPTLREPKQDNLGRPLPQEYECHVRTHLKRTIDQAHLVHGLSNPLERKRKDIWWVHQDGSNASEVAENIAKVLRTKGKRWADRFTNLETALAKVEAGYDCYNKYYVAAALAGRLGDDEKSAKYDLLAQEEARQKGFELSTACGPFL